MGSSQMVQGSPAQIAQPDPVSKSACVLGAVSACIFPIPLGGIVSIILGIVAIKKAGQGRAAVEASGGALRGKGAYMAGKIMGICGICFGAFFTIYWGAILVALLFLKSAAVHL